MVLIESGKQNSLFQVRMGNDVLEIDSKSGYIGYVCAWVCMHKAFLTRVTWLLDQGLLASLGFVERKFLTFGLIFLLQEGSLY